MKMDLEKKYEECDYLKIVSMNINLPINIYCKNDPSTYNKY